MHKSIQFMRKSIQFMHKLLTVERRWRSKSWISTIPYGVFSIIFAVKKEKRLEARDRGGARHCAGPFHEGDCQSAVYLGKYCGDPPPEHLRETRRAQHGRTHREGDCSWLYQRRRAVLMIT